MNRRTGWSRLGRKAAAASAAVATLLTLMATSPAEAEEVRLRCQVDGPVISWNDVGDGPYEVTRRITPMSRFELPDINYIAEDVGTTDQRTITDPQPVIGASYSVEAASGELAFCDSQPDGQEVCAHSGGELSWIPFVSTSDLGPGTGLLRLNQEGQTTRPGAPVELNDGTYDPGDDIFVDADYEPGDIYAILYQGDDFHVCTDLNGGPAEVLETPSDGSLICEVGPTKIVWNDVSGRATIRLVLDDGTLQFMAQVSNTTSWFHSVWSDNELGALETYQLTIGDQSTECGGDDGPVEPVDPIDPVDPVDPTDPSDGDDDTTESPECSSKGAKGKSKSKGKSRNNPVTCR